MELFDLPETLSPRLKWMQGHRLRIIDNGPHLEPGAECPETGATLYRFCATAHPVDGPFWDHETGWGDSQDEALTDWAKKQKTPLWNELP